MIVVLIGTHLFLTVRLRLIQRHTFRGIKYSVSAEPGVVIDRKEHISPFAALTTALAATIGTGNIVGVATAVAMGGAGAVFWCWITGVLGIATKFAEGYLAVKYRESDGNGGYRGGPMYVLKNGLGRKKAAVAFAALTVIASFGIGCMTQVNSIVDIIGSEIGNLTGGASGNTTGASSPNVIIGLIISVLVFIIIIGGIKSISRVCEKLVPLMAVFYVAGCVIILVLNAPFILPAVSTIFREAFTLKAASGGVLGGGIMLAVRYGIARGLFSNESGLGSAPIASATVKTNSPYRQGLVSMTGTFWDTVIICAITGIVLVSSILKNPGINLDPNTGELLQGGALSHAVFAQIPAIGPTILTIGLSTFAFSTILGWAYYGSSAMEYFVENTLVKGIGGLNSKRKSRKAVMFYRIAYTAAVMLGAVTTINVVFDFADFANAMMCLPNVMSLILLSPLLAREVKWSASETEAAEAEALAASPKKGFAEKWFSTE
ncbi:transporter [Clostridia bacterium]|nr:transporter [Clostridia bacterium]